MRPASAVDRADRCLSPITPRVVLVLATLLVGCSNDPLRVPQGRGYSVLRVSMTTSGLDIDTNGYYVTVDALVRPQHVEPNGSAMFYGL